MLAFVAVSQQEIRMIADDTFLYINLAHFSEWYLIPLQLFLLTVAGVDGADGSKHLLGQGACPARSYSLALAETIRYLRSKINIFTYRLSKLRL